MGQLKPHQYTRPGNGERTAAAAAVARITAAGPHEH